MRVREVDQLRLSDLKRNPVWEYWAGGNDTKVRPVTEMPVSSLSGRIVGTEVLLANGTRVWALIGNVDVDNPRLTRHTITLSIERDGRWFHLARYHDFDFDCRGPEALARFLSFDVDAVFPISYDLRRYVKADPAAVVGEISKHPSERLSRAEIVAMAVPEGG